MSRPNPAFPLPPELESLSPDLKNQAFTHRSRRAQQVAKHLTNERLEFLGDAVLELCVSEFLVARYERQDEGVLTRYRAAIVKTDALAIVAQELHLADHLHMGSYEPIPPEDMSTSLLADTFESVVGALYLDQGYESAKNFIHHYLLPHLDEFIADYDAKDPKTVLQEHVQSLGLPAPVYDIIAENGPDHSKEFTAVVELPDGQKASGSGQSKQKAEQSAAAAALEILEKTS